MENEVRTLGDGMDNTLVYGPQTQVNMLNLSNLKIDTKITNSIIKSLKPLNPKSKVFQLVPKYVPKERKVPKCLIKKPKEPVFVPYEPYKAAVEPIISKKKLDKQVSYVKASKNNIEIQELVSQMTAMRELEMRKINLIESENEETFKLRLQWDKEKEGYETDIKNLRETNSHLENQLKFQVQVNSELKTLLVAAVGEDLESRVQHLTEDKLSLARALLNSANHLTSHQEQTEWLSGQCEVWRSKFLASSLMVEELAKWKSALTNRINDLQEASKHMLEDHRKVYNQALKTCNSLKLVTEKLTNNEKTVNLKYGNIVDIMNVTQELSETILKALNLQEIKIHSGVHIPMQYTITEKTVLKEVSKCSSNIPRCMDVARIVKVISKIFSIYLHSEGHIKPLDIKGISCGNKTNVYCKIISTGKEILQYLARSDSSCITS